MESNEIDPSQLPANQITEDGGLMVIVTDSFGTTGGDDAPPQDQTVTG
jgi:hypothetical protein